MHRASLSLALLSVFGAAAQQPQWRTTLPPIQQSGLHVVHVSPEVVGRSQVGLQDVRLVAPDSSLVPYLLRVEPESTTAARTVPITLLRNEQVGVRTIVEIEVPSGTLMDGLELSVRNAQVNKAARITGSDDRQQWYMVKDQGIILTGDGAARSLRWLDLPLSDHRYYRIELNDSLTPPVQVLGVGHTMQARTEGRYVRLDHVRWERREEPGRTVFMVHGDHPLQVDRLHYSTTDTLPFLREATLYTMRSELRTERRQRKVLHRWREELGTATLASYQRRYLPGPGRCVDTLFIEVRNGDDRPLAITAWNVEQRQRSLLAYLTAGQTYTLTTGDKQAKAPTFDLVHFSDSLPTPVATIDLPALSAVAPAAPPNIPFDLSSALVWVALVLVGGLSALAAVRMLRS
jgi:hypothetical protein